MNAAVRAVVRMGIYVGAKVYFIREVSPSLLSEDKLTFLCFAYSIHQVENSGPRVGVLSYQNSLSLHRV